MKQRLQGMVMGVLLAVLLLGTMTVFAANTRTIEVSFGGYRTYLFEQEIVVRDDDGKIIEPFSHNGHVFIPVDTVLHAMRENATWDEKRGVLRFGQVTAERVKIPLQETAPFFDSGLITSLGSTIRQISGRPILWTRNSVRMGGNTFRDVLVYTSQGSNAQHSSFTLHNLSGRYMLLTGYIGRVDETASRDAVARFFGDGTLIQSININRGALPVTFSIPVENVNLLRIEFVFQRGPTGVVTYALLGFLE